ncbi:hypothetical protein SUGI_0462740 [Cryptomeria japonica]|nr:hypothetical protein SUGI_0462740 [Cryptomeria japonica]
MQTTFQRVGKGNKKGGKKRSLQIYEVIVCIPRGLVSPQLAHYWPQLGRKSKSKECLVVHFVSTADLEKTLNWRYWFLKGKS